MPVQRAAGAFVGPDVAVDRLVADRELAVAPEPAGHLLRTPIFPQQHLDPRPVGSGELLIAPRSGATAAGIPIGELRAVAAVAGCAVAPEFTPDRAPMTTKDPRDGGRPQPSSSQQAERISFRRGDLVVQHRRLLSLGGDKSPMVSPGHLFRRRSCCTYYMNARSLTRA